MTTVSQLLESMLDGLYGKGNDGGAQSVVERVVFYFNERGSLTAIFVEALNQGVRNEDLISRMLQDIPF